jgi:predicted MFS family arabinose efflux permease
MKPRGSSKSLDWAGFASLIGTVVPLLLALTWATQYGWSSTRVESLLVLSAVMLAVLLLVESRASEPVIPLELYRDPVIAVCAVAAFTLGVGMFGTIIYLPLFMQGVLGASATQSGNLLTPLLMASMAGSIVGGQTVSRTGSYKVIAVAGSVIIAIGMVLFARMGDDTVRSYVVMAMVVAGVGWDCCSLSIPSLCRTWRRSAGWARRRRQRSFSDRLAARSAWRRSDPSC